MTPEPSSPRLPGRDLSRLLSPRRWPVRWRIAAVSAGLTLLILVIFAAVVGRLVSDRLTDDFNEQVSTTAAQAAVEIRAFASGISVSNEMAITGADAWRIVLEDGRVINQSSTLVDLPPAEEGLATDGSLRVATEPISPDGSLQPVYLQYARSTDSLEQTTDKLWLFLGLGVLGGTLLATLAGLAVANRAMRPIARLTATARDIASTRDPSRRMPLSESEDEVAELALTLDQMLRELDAARTESEQMVQVQREFIADASHELRTPLTSILANLELLQEQLDGARRRGDEGEAVASALRSSKRMRRLVGDLLILARADAGRLGVRRDVDLAKVAGAAVREVAPVADGHVIEFRTDPPIPIEGNPDELHRLVVNLLDNGIRHTPPGSEIELVVERRNGDAILEVSDDGPGIPPEVADHIFSRFVRGGSADVAASPGTGLGLAIVKAVAQSHGGDVDAGSSPSGGARFTVHLPLRAAPKAPTGVDPEPAEV